MYLVQLVLLNRNIYNWFFNPVKRNETILTLNSNNIFFRILLIYSICVSFFLQWSDTPRFYHSHTLNEAQRPEAKWQLSQLPCAKWRNKDGTKSRPRHHRNHQHHRRQLLTTPCCGGCGPVSLLLTKKYKKTESEKKPQRIPFNAHVFDICLLLQIHPYIFSCIYLL